MLHEDIHAAEGRRRTLDASSLSEGPSLDCLPPRQLRGARSLAQGITQANAIEELYLAWSGLGDEGGSHIAQALIKNSSIQVMDVSGCSLGFATCTVLTEVMQVGWVRNDAKKPKVPTHLFLWTLDPSGEQDAGSSYVEGQPAGQGGHEETGQGHDEDPKGRAA